MDLMRKTGLTLGVGLALFLVGCGSSHNGNKTNTVNTGTNAGSLAYLEIDPAPGSVFISKNTTFRLTWADGATPPPTFSVTLQRYKEGGDSGSTDAQKTNLNRDGDSYVWYLSRSNDTTLDSPGTYYVQVDAPDEQVLASYIVSSERSEAVAATKAASVHEAAEPAQGDNAYVHTVHVGGTQP